ncbi:hypothetical protein ACN2C7_18535 [Caulobacter sp. ErkDOM-E]|uniref:hypothetical protein n=1 Tax=Caulobacter sp. ErkDOM-E TaxID=3402778 RepID=UPI003AF42D1C
MRRSATALLLILPLAAAGPAVAGETACWFENGAIVAPAAIADMTGDFVIDLSAPRTLLHNTKAQMSGYAELDLTLPVRLAGQRVEAAPILVSDLDYRGVGFIAPIAGVIGADILGRYVVIIDFAPCRLRLEPQGWAERSRGRGLPVTVVGGVPTVQATASDGFSSLTGAFALDTASNGGVRARGDADGPRQKPAGVLAGLSLDGRLRQRVAAVRAGDLPPGVAGAVGVAILSDYRLRLDAQAGRLWLTPARLESKEKGPGVTARP